MMDWRQQTLLEGDTIQVEVRLSWLAGWEWTIKHHERGHGWSVLDSGTANSDSQACFEAGQALLFAGQFLEDEVF